MGFTQRRPSRHGRPRTPAYAADAEQETTTTENATDTHRDVTDGANGTNRTSEDSPVADATATFVPTPFAEATDVTDLIAERRRLKRNLVIMRVITVTLLVAAIAVAGFPLALQWKSSMELAATAATSARNVAGWPYPQAEDKLKAAHAYNEKLAASGQPVLGEAVDPFSAAQGGSQASGKDSASKKDKEYQSLLDAGNGVMGTIRVPKQSIDLPIYHGTSEEALASGAGHLYGTSLPVGGKSTHSVITGHRGLVEAMMFTRLDEVRKGDFFYIEVMGETLAYEVDRITVILPNDTSQLKIVPGEDRVTLMTCTPYGVNTHRLLVSGHRVSIPIPAPNPSDVHDARDIAIGVGIGALLLGWLALLPWRRRNEARIMRHAAFWPYDRPIDREPAHDPLASADGTAADISADSPTDASADTPDGVPTGTPSGGGTPSDESTPKAASEDVSAAGSEA